MSTKDISLADQIIEHLGGPDGLEQLGARKVQTEDGGISFFIDGGQQIFVVLIRQVGKGFDVLVSHVHLKMRVADMRGVEPAKLRWAVKALQSANFSD